VAQQVQPLPGPRVFFEPLQGQEARRGGVPIGHARVATDQQDRAVRSGQTNDEADDVLGEAGP